MRLEQYTRNMGLTPEIGAVPMQGNPSPLEGLAPLAEGLAQRQQLIKSAQRTAQGQAAILGYESYANELLEKAELNPAQADFDELTKQSAEGFEKAKGLLGNDATLTAKYGSALEFSYRETEAKIRNLQRQAIIIRAQNDFSQYRDLKKNQFIQSNFDTKKRVKLWAEFQARFEDMARSGFVKPEMALEALDQYKRDFWNEAVLSDLQKDPELTLSHLKDGVQLEQGKIPGYALDADQETELLALAENTVKKITEERYSNDFSLRLFPGDTVKARPSQEELNAALKEGHISDALYRVFSGQLESLQEIDKKEAQMQQLLSIIGQIDPKSNDQSKIVDYKGELFLNDLLRANPHPAEAAVRLTQFSQQYGYVPDSFRSVLRRANAADDPNQARNALYLLRELRLHPGLYAQVPENEYENLLGLMARIDSGELRTTPNGQDNFSELFQESQKSLQNKGERAGRSSQLSNPVFMAEFEGKVRKEIKSKLLGSRSDRYEDAALIGEVLSTARNNFLYNSYSPDEAIYRAVEGARKKYTDTGIGQARFMKNPPELYRYNLDTKSANDEIKQRLESIEAEGFDGNKTKPFSGKPFVLQSDAMTESKEPRSWLVKVDTDGDGIFETHAHDADGNFLRWTLPQVEAPKVENPDDSKASTEEVIARFRRQKTAELEGAINAGENSYLYQIPGPNGSFFGSHTPLIQMR